MKAAQDGQASAAVVQLSEVYKNSAFSAGSGWILPANLYKPLKQNAVILTPGEGNKTVEKFMKFVADNPKVKDIIKSYGYGL